MGELLGALIQLILEALFGLLPKPVQMGCLTLIVVVMVLAFMEWSLTSRGHHGAISGLSVAVA
jgi:type IV secretory pathway TrbL component